MYPYQVISPSFRKPQYPAIQQVVSAENIEKLKVQSHNSHVFLQIKGLA